LGSFGVLERWGYLLVGEFWSFGALGLFVSWVVLERRVYLLVYIDEVPYQPAVQAGRGRQDDK